MKIWLAIVASLGFAACSRADSPAPAPTPSAAKDPALGRKLVAAGAIVIDVRTADEYAEAHLPQAINIPVQELPARIGEVDKLVNGDKARPIVVYCAAGSRAAKAKTQLDAAGYSQIVNGGGLDDLDAADHP